jgi:hypothetical protein
MDYTVGDFGYLVDDDSGDFFDEDDVLKDDDEFKPGFLDEADDEFFKTLDEEPVNHYAEYEKRNQINRSNNQVIKIEINPDGTIKRISREFKE